jgi:hypothetical protein
MSNYRNRRYEFRKNQRESVTNKEITVNKTVKLCELPFKFGLENYNLKNVFENQKPVGYFGDGAKAPMPTQAQEKTNAAGGFSIL